VALTAGDVADTVWWLVNTPPHVNVTTLELLPTQEANGPMAFHRE
jgi:3-hydroxy acid dehydrogenase/malonic semialdehyde reductase